MPGGLRCSSWTNAICLQREGFTQLQVLSNLREGGSPLVQMLLVGQVEIAERLREPGMEAFNQRIGVRCEVEPMNLHDTRRYVEFKLEKAGYPSPEVFESRAVERIWRIRRRVAQAHQPRLFLRPGPSDLLRPDARHPAHRGRRGQGLHVSRPVRGAHQGGCSAVGRGWPWARGLVVLVALAVVGSGRLFGWWGGGAAPEAARQAAATPGMGEPASAGMQAEQRAAEAGAGTALPAGLQAPEAGASETGAAVVREAHPAPQRNFEDDGGAAGAVVAGVVEEVTPSVERTGVGGEDAGADENLAVSGRFRVNEAFADDPESALGGADVVDQAAMPGLDPPYAGASVQDAQGLPEGAFVADGELDESPPPDAEASDAGGGRVREGAGHPVVGAVSINAVAWSEDDGARIAVLDGLVLREGGSLPSGIVLVRIGKKDLLLEYRGALYRLVWSAQPAETE